MLQLQRTAAPSRIADVLMQPRSGSFTARGCSSDQCEIHVTGNGALSEGKAKYLRKASNPSSLLRLSEVGRVEWQAAAWLTPASGATMAMIVQALRTARMVLRPASVKARWMLTPLQGE